MSNIFDDDKNAIKQLLNDKHTLLEGYITEQLFYNQFLKTAPHPILMDGGQLNIKTGNCFLS